MMHKIFLDKRRKRLLNGLARKLAKAGSTDRTSASGRSRSSRSQENTKVVYSLNKAAKQWRKNFVGHIA